MVKPPELVFLATIGIPTICLMLLILLPFYDRSPERHPLKRPIAMVGAAATVAAMAYLTVLGAIAGPPSEIEIEVAVPVRGGQGTSRPPPAAWAATRSARTATRSAPTSPRSATASARTRSPGRW